MRTGPSIEVGRGSDHGIGSVDGDVLNVLAFWQANREGVPPV